MPILTVDGVASYPPSGNARAGTVKLSSQSEAEMIAPLPAAVETTGTVSPSARTDDREPLVTAVIPTHNREQVIGRAIISVLAQSYPNLEIVVVDDRSTDDTARVVSDFKGHNLRYVKNTGRRGASAARNAGIAEARGSLIAFLDSDDEWMPDKIARQVECFREGPADLGLVYCGVTRINPGGVISHVTPQLRGDIFHDLLVFNHIGSASRIMVRREVFDRVGMFDEFRPTLNDWDMTLRIAERYAVDVVPESCVRYHFEGGDHLSLRARSIFLSHRHIFKTYGTDYYPLRRRATHLAHIGLQLAKLGRRRKARRFARLGALMAPLDRKVLRMAYRAHLA